MGLAILSLVPSINSHVPQHTLITTIQGWPAGCLPHHFTDEEAELVGVCIQGRVASQGRQDLKTGHSGF